MTSNLVDTYNTQRDAISNAAYVRYKMPDDIFTKFLSRFMCLHYWCAWRGHPHSMSHYYATCLKCRKSASIAGIDVHVIMEITPF